jgi:soluble cytochrome b562
MTKLFRKRTKKELEKMRKAFEELQEIAEEARKERERLGIKFDSTKELRRFRYGDSSGS